ncbi:MAG: LysR family transcriptional regulator [Clostridia bacterium]|nr:LysR family transcriptional regulator [Clostridia bacterium]
MELIQLRYFIDTAKTQHITQSAERLHISQPALTKSIHNLEVELGVPLFTHKGRGVVLTEYGRYLYEKLCPIVAAIDNLSEELASMTETENMTLRLSVNAASSIVTEAIIEYRKTHPGINFHVIQNRKNELYDIEITTGTAYVHNDFDDEFVCSEKIFLAVPSDGKYSSVDKIALEDVKNEGFVSLFGSKQLRSICDGFCKRSGFEANIIFESDSPDAVKNMIGSSIGIGFWPEFTWGKLTGDHVKLLKITSPECKRNIIISYKNLKSDSTYVKGFYNFLVDFFKKRRADV